VAVVRDGVLSGTEQVAAQDQSVNGVTLAAISAAAPWEEVPLD